jgi:thermitase
MRRDLRGLAVALVAAACLCLCATWLPAAGAAAASGDEAAASTGRAIVLVSSPDAVGRGSLADPSTEAGERRAERRIDGLVERNDLDAVAALPELGALAVELSPGESVRELAARLELQPGVVAVEPEYRRQLRYSPDDPGFAGADANSPTGTRQWNLIQEGFRRGWRYAPRGGGVTVAVIDTGIDGNHPDLRSKIRFAVDQDAEHTTSARYDDYGHGTHVAGLACATGDNGFGMVGAGFNCKLGVEKTDLTDFSIATSIRDATSRGARVINMSFGGGPPSSVMASAINYAWDHGVVMVSAASNKHVSDQGYPAGYLQPSGTGQSISSGKGLVVTGAYETGHNAGTGYGSGISMAAYGFAHNDPPGIFSTFPDNHAEIEDPCALLCTPPTPACGCRTSFRGSDDWAYLQGTSMATPQVAGAAALLRALRPRLSARKVMTVLKAQAAGNYAPGLGWGILDAGAAIRYAHDHYRR